MNKTATLVAAILLCGACQNRDVSPRQDSATDAEVRRLEERVKTLESDVMGAQKALIASQEKAEDLRRRLAAIEARFQIADQGVPIAAPVSEVVPKRGGFTDFGQSVNASAASAPPPGAIGATPAVVSATYRITESNSTWSRFAYNVRVSSYSEANVDVTVQFKDSGGFVVDTDTIYNAPVRAGLTDLSDHALINADSVSKVSSMVAVAKKRQ